MPSSRNIPLKERRRAPHPYTPAAEQQRESSLISKLIEVQSPGTAFYIAALMHKNAPTQQNTAATDTRALFVSGYDPQNPDTTSKFRTMVAQLATGQQTPKQEQPAASTPAAPSSIAANTKSSRST